MEPVQVLLEAAEDQRVIGAATKAALYLFADDQILGIEHTRVDQLEGAAPMLSLFTGRLLWH